MGCSTLVSPTTQNHAMMLTTATLPQHERLTGRATVWALNAEIGTHSVAVHVGSSAQHVGEHMHDIYKAEK